MSGEVEQLFFRKVGKSSHTNLHLSESMMVLILCPIGLKSYILCLALRPPKMYTSSVLLSSDRQSIKCTQGELEGYSQ